MQTNDGLILTLVTKKKFDFAFLAQKAKKANLFFLMLCGGVCCNGTGGEEKLDPNIPKSAYGSCGGFDDVWVEEAGTQGNMMSVAVIHEYDRAGLPGSLSSISDGAGVRGSHIQHP